MKVLEPAPQGMVAPQASEDTRCDVKTQSRPRDAYLTVHALPGIHTLPATSLNPDICLGMLHPLP